MSPPAREKFREACDQDSKSLWNSANGVERWIVKGRAKLAMAQLLEESKGAAHANKQ
jgi:hypothetical protein